MKNPWEFYEKEKPIAENTDEELSAERERIRENMTLETDWEV
jgi:hypothetical protein